MLSLAGWRCYDVGSYPSDALDAVNTEDGDIDSQWTGPGDRLHRFDHPDTLALPDLDDPATLGCLLALVRLAWGDPAICVQHRGGLSKSVDAWMIKTETNPTGYGSGHWTGRTEAEALVAALEAAP